MESSCLWRGSDSIEAGCSSNRQARHAFKGISAKRSGREAVLPHWLSAALPNSTLNSCICPWSTFISDISICPGGMSMQKAMHLSHCKLSAGQHSMVSTTSAACKHCWHDRHA